jgi:hypothetical protein
MVTIRRVAELVGSVLPALFIAFLVLVVSADVIARNVLRISEIRDSDFANSRTPVSLIPGQSGQG